MLPKTCKRYPFPKPFPQRVSELKKSMISKNCTSKTTKKYDFVVVVDDENFVAEDNMTLKSSSS